MLHVLICRVVILEAALEGPTKLLDPSGQVMERRKRDKRIRTPMRKMILLQQSSKTLSLWM